MASISHFTNANAIAIRKSNDVFEIMAQHESGDALGNI